MEYDNTEDLIKEIIGNREIAPSDHARERLIEALNTKQKKKRVIWLPYAVAASIILMLCFVGAKMMFGSYNDKAPIQKIVNEESQQPINEQPTIIEDKLAETKEEESNKIIVVKESEELPITAAKTNVTQIKDDPLISKAEDNNKLVVVEENRDVVKKPDTLSRKLPKNFIYITAEDLLASTAADSSSLKLNGTLKKTTEKYVESDALLIELERQLFDEKNKGIFNRASREIKKVREAFANRNFEKQELKNL
jgi:hypothetical protein